MGAVCVRSIVGDGQGGEKVNLSPVLQDHFQIQIHFFITLCPYSLSFYSFILFCLLLISFLFFTLPRHVFFPLELHHN